MVELVGPEDERTREIGRRAGLNAFVAVSALFLALIVMRTVTGGVPPIEEIRLELGGLLLGWAVYVVTGLYYTRTI